MALQTKLFTLGSLEYGSYSNAYVLELELTEESVSTVQNTSQVNYVLRLRAGGSNRFEWELTSRLLLGGIQVAQVTEQKYLDYYGTWQLLSGTVTVPHQPDGTLALSCVAQITPYGGGNRYTPPAMTLTETMTMTPIARGSTVSGTSVMIGGTSRITVDRKNDAFSHSLHYAFGDLQGYLTAQGAVSSQEVIFGETNLDFPVPLDFYYEIPNATEGDCTLTVRTYLDGMLVDTPQSGKLRLSADPEVCAPALSVTVCDANEKTVALTQDDQRLVRGCSAAQCSVEAVAKLGASLVSVQVNGQNVTGGQVLIGQVDTAQLHCVVTDSRGYSTRIVTEKTMVPYIPVTCEATVKRNAPTAQEATVQVWGNFYAGSFDAAGNNSNALTLTCTAGGKTYTLTPVIDGNRYTAQAQLQDLDYRSGYPVTVAAVDLLSTAEKNMQLLPGIPVFDWGKSDFAFHVPVTAPSVNDRGSCADPDAATAPGCYRLTADSPVGEGVLTVFAAGTAVLQLAVSKDASMKKWRVLWDGTAGNWNE